MDTRFQASFIPKKPVDTGAYRPSRDVNIALILSILIFIIAAGASGGVYFYKTSLKTQQEERDVLLVNAKKSFGLSDIAELKQRVGQLKSAKAILENHTAMSPIFSLIEQNTLKSVRFRSFSLSKGALRLSGEARGFNAVAYQSQVFTKLTDFSSPAFSNFVLEESGNVSFNFAAQVNPALLLYSKSLEDFGSVPATDNSLINTTQ